jgi:hypothetical protein
MDHCHARIHHRNENLRLPASKTATALSTVDLGAALFYCWVILKSAVSAVLFGGHVLTLNGCPARLQYFGSVLGPGSLRPTF